MNGDENSELPESWLVAPLQEIADINPKLNKSAYADDLEVSFVPMPAVEARNGVIVVNETRQFSALKKGYTAFREGDVLFAKITPCMENGKMAVVPAVKNGLGFGSTEFHVLRPYEGISAEYIYYFVSSQRFRYDAEHNMTGAVGQRRVPAPYLAKQLIPVAAEKAQKRIVAKIEELFSELDKGIDSLKTARQQLNVYRQALLKHAFEGKLTAQWREENQDRLETADQLLARIKKEREARYQKQLEEWKAAVKTWEAGDKSGKKTSKPKKPAKLQGIALEEGASLPTLPEGWTYVRLGLVIDEPKYGTSKKCDYEYEGRGVLRIPNVVSGIIDDSDLKFADFDDGDIETYNLRRGDILTIRSNGSISIVGKCALITENEEKYLYAGYLIRIRSNSDVIVPEYLISVLTSHLLRAQIESKAKSTSGVNNINSGELQSLIIPICGGNEQKDLIDQIVRALSSIDALEIEIDHQLKKSEALRQSILKKAFSGQLVEQDPDDESASLLLERIKAEKAAEKKSNKKNKKRKDAA